MKKINRKTHVLDAAGKSPGRLATEIALLLRGKHKVEFLNYIDSGDSVIVKNASKLSLPLSKLRTKVYYRHTGYIGHLKKETLGDLFKKDPRKVVEKAVKGMIASNKLKKGFIKRLKVYA